MEIYSGKKNCLKHFFHNIISMKTWCSRIHEISLNRLLLELLYRTEYCQYIKTYTFKRGIFKMRVVIV